MGAPVGPRVKPVTVTDGMGEYTVYRGKHCRHPDCGIELASRNRHENQLLCREHRPKRSRSAGRPREKKQASDFAEKTPQAISGHRKVQNILSTWLCDPTDRIAGERLQSALVDYELIYRFTFTELPSPLKEIPLEEPHFTNPEHRTTRQEFLSACDAHGV
jgi:hypothetical protein